MSDLLFCFQGKPNGIVLRVVYIRRPSDLQQFQVKRLSLQDHG